jgi:cold shock CspA family protein
MGDRIKGKVKWYGSKGEAIGFIHRFKHADGTPGEVMVHYRNILPENQDNPKFRTLPKGGDVEFEVGPGYPNANHGTQAIKVILLKEPNGDNAGNAGASGVPAEG